jgi:hypothetical protein
VLRWEDAGDQVQRTAAAGSARVRERGALEERRRRRGDPARDLLCSAAGGTRRRRSVAPPTCWSSWGLPRPAGRRHLGRRPADDDSPTPSPPSPPGPVALRPAGRAPAGPSRPRRLVRGQHRPARVRRPAPPVGRDAELELLLAELAPTAGPPVPEPSAAHPAVGVPLVMLRGTPPSWPGRCVALPRKPARWPAGTRFHLWLRPAGGSSAAGRRRACRAPPTTPQSRTTTCSPSRTAFDASPWASRCRPRSSSLRHGRRRPAAPRSLRRGLHRRPRRPVDVVDWKTGPPKTGAEATAAAVSSRSTGSPGTTTGEPLEHPRAFHHVAAGVTVRPADLLEAGLGADPFGPIRRGPDRAGERRPPRPLAVPASKVGRASLDATGPRTSSPRPAAVNARRCRDRPGWRTVAVVPAAEDVTGRCATPVRPPPRAVPPTHQATIAAQPTCTQGPPGWSPTSTAVARRTAVLPCGLDNRRRHLPWRREVAGAGRGDWVAGVTSLRAGALAGSSRPGAGHPGPVAGSVGLGEQRVPRLRALPACTVGV